MKVERNDRLYAIETGVAVAMKALGIDTTESNKDTPTRIAHMLVDELFSSVNNEGIDKLDEQMTVFPVLMYYSAEPISVSIPFYSMCEHHWLPFFGEVTVKYQPSDKIIGLSKIPRVVKFFSRKPQLQERLTKEIGEYLNKLLCPKYISVEVTAQHMCVSMRGAETPCTTQTSWQSGAFNTVVGG